MIEKLEIRNVKIEGVSFKLFVILTDGIFHSVVPELELSKTIMTLLELSECKIAQKESEAFSDLNTANQQIFSIPDTMPSFTKKDLSREDRILSCIERRSSRN